MGSNEITFLAIAKIAACRLPAVKRHENVLALRNRPVAQDAFHYTMPVEPARTGIKLLLFGSRPCGANNYNGLPTAFNSLTLLGSRDRGCNRGCFRQSRRLVLGLIQIGTGTASMSSGNALRRPVLMAVWEGAAMKYTVHDV